MSKFGIVCEFNPLHNGHEYLIRCAGQLGASSITCVMSGNFTQRGEFAVVDKYARAEAAVSCGADLVLELPFPWSGASAEYFATAAVSILSPFCDKLLFGSECGDIEKLKRAASICDSGDFDRDYATRTTNGEGAASAFLECLQSRGIEKLSSNDLLGVAYIRAINRLGTEIEPVTVKRVGEDYNSKMITAQGYQSATAIREALKKGFSVEKNVPKKMNEILLRETEVGRVSDIKQAENAILGVFRMADTGAFDGIADAGGGVGNRLIRSARESRTYAEMLERAKTKRYTDAKLRRATVFCVTGVNNSDISSLPEYTTLLGVNDKGRELLAANRKGGGIKVVTKPADAPDTRQSRLSSKLDLLYGLTMTERLTEEYFTKKGAYVGNKF